MSVYIKPLKDKQGNTIMPYTKADAIILNDGSTAGDIINSLKKMSFLTETEYTALTTPDANTLYFIIPAEETTGDETT